jgi:hypothetical protein
MIRDRTESDEMPYNEERALINFASFNPPTGFTYRLVGKKRRDPMSEPGTPPKL